MRRLCFASSLLVFIAAGRVAEAAPSGSRDVKVCVRIEEKTFAPDAAPPAKGAPPAPDGTPPAPPTDVPAGAKEKPGAAAPAPSAAPRFAKSDEDANASDPSDPVSTAAFSTTPAVDPSGSSALPPLPAPPASPAGNADDLDSSFLSVDPDLYLRRLVEYHVTHEPGFQSVDEGCTETLTVELYPVRGGYTVFARYSGTGREEKVDVVRPDELGVFAERVTQALLRDRTIAETLTRTTVLRADSETRVRLIRTRTHFLLGMGSGARVGVLPTAPNDVDPAEQQLRIETPLDFSMGARNKFRAWALDATGRLSLGLTERASRRTTGGGHVDYSVGFGLGLGFLVYGDPDAVNTLYYGGGGSFDVSRYQSIAAEDDTGYQAEPDGLWGGGLNIDLTLGYEFMRASALHFFVQGTVRLPAYVFQAENTQARVQSYIPSAAAQLGLLF